MKRSIAVLLVAWLFPLVVSARQTEVGFDECVDLVATGFRPAASVASGHP